jgi:hypothetical protein
LPKKRKRNGSRKRHVNRKRPSKKQKDNELSV